MSALPLRPEIGPRNWNIRLGPKTDLTSISPLDMVLLPHDHRMWAVIGIYGGCKDNTFWRRKNGPNGKLGPVAAKALSERDAKHNIVHSAINPIPRLTAAIHVYGGDFFTAERSEWDRETLSERRFEPEGLRRRFEEANRNVLQKH
jgi:predicted metal-dependent enzyme (double-stranded beta helix superfamily)